MPSPATVIRCVIVDDHRMLLDLLADAVNGMPGLTVAATATDVADADRLAALRHVDLLIVDRRLRTGDGMDVVRTVAARHPRVKCIIFAGITSDFICPPDLADIIVSVVDKSHASATTLLNEIARIVELPRNALDRHMPSGEIRSRLTAREWDLFVALGDGLSNKELGTHFGISTRTVETHRKAIARKLGVSGAALMRLAVLRRRSPDEPLSAAEPEERVE